jgi:putative transposase
MKRSRYSDEQIAYALRQAEGGTPIADVCRTMGISEATFYIYGLLPLCKCHHLR